MIVCSLANLKCHTMYNVWPDCDDGDLFAYFTVLCIERVACLFVLVSNSISTVKVLRMKNNKNEHVKRLT